MATRRFYRIELFVIVCTFLVALQTLWFTSVVLQDTFCRSATAVPKVLSQFVVSKTEDHKSPNIEEEEINEGIEHDDLVRRYHESSDKKERQKIALRRDYVVMGKLVIDGLYDRILERLSRSANVRVGELKAWASSGMAFQMMHFGCYRMTGEVFSRRCVDVQKNSYALGPLETLMYMCSTPLVTETMIRNALLAECTEDYYRDLRGVNCKPNPMPVIIKFMGLSVSE